MKKIFISCCVIALLLFPVCSSIGFAAGDNDLANIETANVDFDYVVLAQGQSKSVSAGLDSLLSFQIIPVTLFGSGTGALTTSISRSNTQGEIIYMYQFFPGVPTAAFNIGITPVSMRVSSAIPNLDYGAVVGFVFTGILFSTETPPYGYNVSLSF